MTGTSIGTPVSLQQLLTPSRTVDIDFPGFEGTTISLCHLAREELVKLRKSCVTTKFNRSTHQPEEVLNEDKFVDAYSRAVVKGWKGFKYKYLEELILVDISGLDPEDELVYTQENAVMLLKNSDQFERWVQDSLGDLTNFTKSK